MTRSRCKLGVIQKRAPLSFSMEEDTRPCGTIYHNISQNDRVNNIYDQNVCQTVYLRTFCSLHLMFERLGNRALHEVTHVNSYSCEDN